MGVYFSANDVVYDWAIAFLNSYRTFNPDLRLILIPFNDECDRLLKLQDAYNFEIYTDPSFERLEAIGRSLELGYTTAGPYWFRRYATFWGTCDRFMYLDARQIVLADLKPIIQALDDYDFELLHFDCAINQVYQPGELRQTLLRQGRARGFLSGLWASRKGLFTLEEFEKFAANVLQVREQLNPRNTDQAFFNYCCDTKPVRYGHIAEILGSICQTSWARQASKIYQENGKYYLWDHGGLDHKKQLALIHWAGYRWVDFFPHKFLLLSFSKNRMYLIVFLTYVILFLFSLPSRLLKKLVSQRNVNQLYHSLRAKLWKA